MLNITDADLQVLTTAFDREVREGGPVTAIHELQDIIKAGDNTLTMDQLDELDGVVNREMEDIDDSDERDNDAYELLLDMYDRINDYREELYAA